MGPASRSLNCLHARGVDWPNPTLAAGSAATAAMSVPIQSGLTVACWKAGGVCSLRRYALHADSEAALLPTSWGLGLLVPADSSRATRYIGGSVRLFSTIPMRCLGAVNFLERVPLVGGEGTESASREEVGRIDNVLVVRNSAPLQWCTVEIQAVYFSGDRMEHEFAALRDNQAGGLPFPVEPWRPTTGVAVPSA